MRPRLLALPLIALLGAAVGTLPGIATGSSAANTASFAAFDFGWHANGGTTNTATIAPGGTVTISYPSGSSTHNADFAGGPQPTSCTQTAGTNSGTVPPLPHSPTASGWSGTCTFDTPGTYTFHCDLHAFMTATITVEASGTTTTTTTGTTTTGTTTTGTTTTTTPTTTPGGTTTTLPGTTTSTTPTSPPPPPPVPPPFPAARAIKVPAVQHGTRIHGSVRILKAGARLEVDVLATRRSLAARVSRMTRVGRLVKTHLRPGIVRFSVPLDANAIRALRRRHQLTLTVRVTVRAAGASTKSVVRRIQMFSSG